MRCHNALNIDWQVNEGANTKALFSFTFLTFPVYNFQVVSLELSLYGSQTQSQQCWPFFHVCQNTDAEWVRKLNLSYSESFVYFRSKLNSYLKLLNIRVKLLCSFNKNSPHNLFCYKIFIYRLQWVTFQGQTSMCWRWQVLRRTSRNSSWFWRIWQTTSRRKIQAKVIKYEISGEIMSTIIILAVKIVKKQPKKSYWIFVGRV